MTLDELVSQLRAAYGTALRSIVLYGSAAAGEHIPKRSDYNVLVIVDALDAERLAAASAASRAWTEAGNPAPLTLTTSEWRGSSDIFPMEYADILDRHKVLFGDPTFEVIKLRQGILASGNDGQRQLDLLAASIGAVMVVFRAFLRLHGTQPPKDNVALAEAVAREAKFDPAPFARVVTHVRGKDQLKSGDAGPVIAGYLRGMEQLVEHLDRYEPST
jgi:hypothetical protein